MISVIVPVYNLENELERCVKSIQKQTYENIEIVLVNDGSTDGSESVMKALSENDPRIRIVRQENEGVTAARLNGVRLSSGEYIGFVDGDDEIEEEMYDFLFDNIAKYDADISHCGYQMCFADGRIHYFYNSGTVREQNTVTGVKDLLEGTIVEPGLGNKLFKRELFDELLDKNLMDQSIKINEDLLMNYYLFKQIRKAVFEDKCPYHYVVRSSSASRQKMNEHKIYDPIKVKQKILEDCCDELKIVAEAALVNTAIYTLARLSTEKRTDYQKEKKSVRKVICEHKSVISHLAKRTALLGKMIVYAPGIFMFLYPIYTERIQVKKYE